MDDRVRGTRAATVYLVKSRRAAGRPRHRAVLEILEQALEGAKRTT
jgi:hypothetical protein